MLADLLEERAAAVKQVGLLDSIEDENFPDWTRQIAAAGSLTFDQGLQDLSTKKVAVFNNDNIGALPPDVVMNTVGGDADINENGQIDRNPDEYADLRRFSFILRKGDQIAPDAIRYSVNAMWLILRNTESIKMACCRQTSTLGIKRRIATITAKPSAIAIPNDTLVTGFSAIGTGSILSRTAHNELYLGATGRNHANIANAGVAAQIVIWIFEVEETNGDLRKE